MKNVSIFSLFLLGILFVTGLPMTGSAFPLRIPGKFISFGAGENGTIWLLSAQNQLVKVVGDQPQAPVPLPPLPKEETEAGFCDFTIRGTKVFFCRFPTSKLYVLDLNNPSTFTVLQPHPIDTDFSGFMQVCPTQDGLMLLDADNNLFEMNSKGLLTKLPPNAQLPLTSLGELTFLPEPLISEKGVKTWKILSKSGAELISRTDPGNNVEITGLGALGFVSDGRLIIQEVSGEGEMKSRQALHAVKDGKIVASKEIPDAENLTTTKDMILLPDGTVFLLRLDEKGEGVILSRLQL
jgi:hypothetical protein